MRISDWSSDVCSSDLRGCAATWGWSASCFSRPRSGAEPSPLASAKQLIEVLDAIDGIGVEVVGAAVAQLLGGAAGQAVGGAGDAAADADAGDAQRLQLLKRRRPVAGEDVERPCDALDQPADRLAVGDAGNEQAARAGRVIGIGAADRILQNLRALADAEETVGARIDDEFDAHRVGGFAPGLDALDREGEVEERLAAGGGVRLGAGLDIGADPDRTAHV